MRVTVKIDKEPNDSDSENRFDLMRMIWKTIRTNDEWLWKSIWTNESDSENRFKLMTLL